MSEPLDRAPDHAQPADATLAALARVRSEIRRVDRRLVALLAERVRLAREAGRLKRAAGLPIRDPAQERVVLARLRRAAERTGLDLVELRAVMHRVVRLSRRAQGGDDRSA